MKPPEIKINGVALDRVCTPQRKERPSRGVTFLGIPRHTLREAGERLLLTMHPLTAAQLYFDGVLPRDRTHPIELQVDHQEAGNWRILSMETYEHRGREPLVLFRLERDHEDSAVHIAKRLGKERP